MPATFDPYSGVFARVLAAIVAPTSGSDLFTPTGAETKTNLVEMTTWSVTKPRDGGKVIAAGCPVDSRGNIYPRRLRGGIIDPVVNIEGVYNGNNAGGARSDERFAVGACVVFNLQFHTVGLLGYYSVVGVVKSSDIGTKIAGDPATWKCSIEVDGGFPDPTTS